MRTALTAVAIFATAGLAGTSAHASEATVQATEDFVGPGLELGARTGYAFAAGRRGAPANGSDDNLGDWVGGQWPIWLDLGYRFDRTLYLGGFFQYGIGTVNDDQQAYCRNANVSCSASDLRVGVMGRFHLSSVGPASPWLGLGVGYEWGSFSVDGSIPQLGVAGNAHNNWSGIEFANLQAGADFRVGDRMVVAPFVSASLGEYRSTSSSATAAGITTTTDGDVAKTSLHEWILIGARFALVP